MTLIKGTANDDILTGVGSSDETFEAYSGNDFVNGNDGSDIIYGGTGNDDLRGGGDKDTVFGGTGNDTLRGGPGDDTVFGGDGNDLFFQNNDGSTNTLIGGDDEDHLNMSASTVGWTLNGTTDSGSSGTSSIEFHEIEIITVSDHADVITAGGSIEVIYAGDGNDQLINTGGRDRNLYGGLGSDTLIASGSGFAENLFGGIDTDTYILNDASGDYNDLALFGGGFGDHRLLLQGQADGDAQELYFGTSIIWNLTPSGCSKM